MAVTTAFMGILSSKSAEAERAPVVHVAFNVMGILKWLPLIWLVEDPDYVNLVRLQMAFVDQMRRIYTLAKRIAKVALPPALAERD